MKKMKDIKKFLGKYFLARDIREHYKSDIAFAQNCDISPDLLLDNFSMRGMERDLDMDDCAYFPNKISALSMAACLIHPYVGLAGMTIGEIMRLRGRLKYDKRRRCYESKKREYLEGQCGGECSNESSVEEKIRRRLKQLGWREEQIKKKIKELEDEKKRMDNWKENGDYKFPDAF